MTDNSDLVKLIIERFDDLNHRVDELKRDLAGRYDQHEQDDRQRFQQIQSELEPLKQAKWSTAKVAGSSTAVVTLLAELLRQFLAK